MLCESCRQALSEAAASGEALPREVRLHLAGCNACTAVFAEERELFAAIDSAMGTTVNVEVPASLLPRVRAQIAASPEKAVWRLPVLAFLTALLVGVAVLSPLLRRSQVVGRSGNKDLAVAAAESADRSETTAAAAAADAPEIGALPKPEKTMIRRLPVRLQPEVLVSPEEPAGLERYAALLRVRAQQPSQLATGKKDSELAIQPLEIALLALPQLTIEPLESGEEQ